MITSDLRGVGAAVFHLLARRRKALAPIARAVHSAFELKHDLEKVAEPDHPGLSPTELTWRLCLQKIKASAERTISGMPAEFVQRHSQLRALRYRVLDEIAAAAKEMGDVKTSITVSHIRWREYNRFEARVTIDQVTREPLRGFKP